MFVDDIKTFSGKLVDTLELDFLKQIIEIVWYSEQIPSTDGRNY